MKHTYIPAFNFDFLTPVYDLLANILGFGTNQRKKIVSLLNLTKDEHLLDVGCGTGSLLVVAKKLFPQMSMVGIDVDKKILDLAKQKAKNKKLAIEFLHSGAEHIPFSTASFDVVVSSLVFHHLPTDIKKMALKEIHRVLKNKGRFLLVDFGAKNSQLISIYCRIATFLHIPEATTLKENIEGKLPIYIKEAGFAYKEVAPTYYGIQFLLCRKI